MSKEELYKVAMEMRRREDFAHAATVFLHLWEESPAESGLAWHGAECALKAGRPAQAFTLLKTVIQARGADASTCRLMAEILIAGANYDEAESMLRRALASIPDDVDLLLMLGRCRHFARDYNAAIDAFLKALALKPDLVPAMEALRAVNSSMGRVEEVKSWAERAGEHHAAPPSLVLSDETSALSDREYAGALDSLEQVAAMIAHRDELPGDHVGRPSGQWDRGEDSHDAYHLLKTGDRDVIRKLRFYTQEFSGYKLPTLEPARGHTPITTKLPDNYDAFLRIWSPSPQPGLFDSVRAVPERLRVLQPRKFGEIGWALDDGLVNMETYAALVYLVELDENGTLDLLARAGIERPPVVMEIGGGYGNLGRCVLRMVPDARYIIVDLAESLAFSSIYLRTLYPDADVEFVDAGETCRRLDRPGLTFISSAAFGPDVLGAGRADLAVNTMSLAEMSDPQKESYARGIAALLADDGAFFEQNQMPLPGFPLVQSIIRPYFGESTPFRPSSLPLIHAGTGHLWRKPIRQRE